MMLTTFAAPSVNIVQSLLVDNLVRERHLSLLLNFVNGAKSSESVLSSVYHW